MVECECELKDQLQAEKMIPCIEAVPTMQGFIALFSRGEIKVFHLYDPLLPPADGTLPRFASELYLSILTPRAELWTLDR